MPAHNDADFAAFYEASYGRVISVVAAIVGDRGQAEDITQEAFSRALIRWRRLARYDVPEAWVRRVAIRLTIDAARRRRRAALLPSLLAAGMRGAAAGRHDPDDPLEATALTVALLRLPLQERQVLVLYYLADLPMADIARDCGISVSTVRNRLGAARHQLHHELLECDESGKCGDSDAEVRLAR